jgi:hypothetical protein
MTVAQRSAASCAAPAQWDERCGAAVRRQALRLTVKGRRLGDVLHGALCRHHGRRRVHRGHGAVGVQARVLGERSGEVGAGVAVVGGGAVAERRELGVEGGHLRGERIGHAVRRQSGGVRAEVEQGCAAPRECGSTGTGPGWRRRV